MLEALDESSTEDAIEVKKQIVNEFIIEQEGEGKLNREIDSLLDRVDFSEPMSPVGVPHENMSTHTTSFEVQVSTLSLKKFFIL